MADDDRGETRDIRGRASTGDVDLARKVRNLRRWLLAVTAVFALSVLAIGAFAWLFVSRFAGMEGPVVKPEQVAEIRQEYEKALGPRLAQLKVRAVRVDYGDAMGPVPFFTPREELVYVEYRLKDSKVVFANLGGPGGEVDLLPSRGSLESRMTDDQFAALLRAYEAETAAPFGGVHRYTDRGFDGPSNVSASDALTVAGKKYPQDELWVVSEGVVVEGDTFKPNEVMHGSRAMVFHEDPKTGAFVFIGTDDSGEWTAW